MIQHAQIKFLQEEFAALLVGGQFESSTAKNSGPCRKTRLVLTRIRSKPFEQRQRCRQRVVPREDSREPLHEQTRLFPDPRVDVTVTDSGVLSTAGRRTCSSPLRIDSSRDDNQGKIATRRTLIREISVPFVVTADLYV
ncbi:hypothetical protein DPMN_070191 [Dreissena polymorpha]|uniref:Uncharacterized protein n=1 Tax=Dreissena polymorpha TaxID=45954 RepID=A0A9D3Z5R0_DREPO|nr:hypothetical protein DPMN_070191 [Dreissena polymorpha]